MNLLEEKEKRKYGRWSAVVDHNSNGQTKGKLKDIYSRQVQVNLDLIYSGLESYTIYGCCPALSELGQRPNCAVKWPSGHDHQAMNSNERTSKHAVADRRSGDGLDRHRQRGGTSGSTHALIDAHAQAQQ